eukprot:12922543-Alexandrium_andersonii.AAC.1
MTSSGRRPAQFRFEVASVKRPVSSVADLNDRGVSVHFPSHGMPYLENNMGERTWLKRDGKTFVL